MEGAGVAAVSIGGTISSVAVWNADALKRSQN